MGVTHTDFVADDNCSGHIIRTYEIFDQCGNSTTTSQTIEITDTTRPYFTEEIADQLLVSTNCQFVIPDLTDTVRSRVADNCTSAADLTINQSVAAGTPATSEQDVIVTVSDLCGNSNTITIHVTLPEPLTVEIGQNDTAVCEGQSVTLPTTFNGGVEPYTYAWMPATGLDDASAASPVATPEDGTY